MENITIDGKEYQLNALSDESKVQIASIRFVDAEILRLQGQLAAMQTARIGYSNELQKLLASMP